MRFLSTMIGRPFSTPSLAGGRGRLRALGDRPMQLIS